MSGRRIVRGVWTLFAILGSVAWLAAVAGWFRGAGQVPVLREAPAAGKQIDRYPCVSVVVAARDEEAGVGEALGSVLDQTYPGSLGVLAIDDRSTDGTGEIVSGLAAQRPDRLRPVRPSVPRRRKSRRVAPAQSRAAGLPQRFNMSKPP